MLYPQQKAIEAAAAALNANTATLHLNETMAATFSYLLPLAPATPLVPETNAAATTLSHPHTSACAFFTQALAKSKSAQAAAISFKPCVHPAAEYCPVLGVWFRTEGDASLLAATDDIAVAESTGADEEFFTAADAALVGAAAAAEVAEVEEEEESFLIDAVFDDPFFEDDAVCDEEEEEEAVEAAAAAATSISSSDTATSVTDAANSTYDSAAAESSTSKNVAYIAADEATAVAATKAATSTTKSKAKPKTTKTTAKSTTAAKTKTKTATTTTTTTAKAKAAPKRTAKATASAAAAEVEAAAEAVDEAAAISAISAAATATKAKAKTTTRRSAKKAAPEISIEEPYSPDNTVATAPFAAAAAASSAATAAAAAVADGEVVDEAVAAAIEAADSAMAAGATTTKGKGGAAASGAKGASAASRGPRTAGIKSVQEFYYWGLAKGFFKPNPAVDTIISMMNLNKDYYQKVTNGILPYLSALTAGNLKDLLSDSSQDMPNLLDIITYNKIFYAALHCLKDSTTGQALGKLLNADLAFVAGQLNAIDDQKHKHVSVFIDEVSELANESLVQMLNKARASKFAITIATQCLADLTRRTGSADAAKQVIGNCNNVLALRVNDLESATIVTDSLPATVIPQKSSTISASEGPACLDTYSTSRTVSQQTASIYPASLMMQLPDFEFIARLANGSVYKAFIPIINDSFTNCLSESELSQLKRDYDYAHATTTKSNTATAHAAAAGAAAGAATAAATQSETEATAAAVDDLYAQIKAASTAAEAKAQAMSNAQPQFEGESAADAEVISPDDDIYTNSTLMDLGFNCYTHNSARTPDNSNADSNSAADSTTGADSAAAAAASYAQEFNSGNVLGGQMSVGSTTTEVPTPGHFFIGGCGNLHSKDKATSTASSTGASGGGLYAEIKAAYYAQEQAKAQAAAEAAAAAAAAAATATNAATQDAAKTANQSTSPAATQSAAQAALASPNAASTAASGTGTGARTGAGATAVAQAAAQGSASSQGASQDSTPSDATDAFSTSSSAAKSASSTASSTAETATAAAASASDSASASASASTKPRGMLGKLKQRVVPALTTVLSKLLSEGAIAEYKRLSIGLAMSLPFILIGCLLPFGNTTLGGFFSSVGDVLAIGSNIVAKGLLILQGSPTAPPRYSLLQLLGFLIHNLLIAYMVCILGAITGERLRSKSELYHQTLIGTLSLLMWAPAILLVLALVSYYYDFVYYPEFTMLFYLSAIFYVSMRGTALISMRSK